MTSISDVNTNGLVNEGSNEATVDCNFLLVSCNTFKLPSRALSLSINTLIEKSPFQCKKINLLSIDIENYEYEALKEFNFNKYNIDVIVSEVTDLDSSTLELRNNSLEKITESKIYNLLTRNNYKLINWVNSDLVFINKKSKF